MKFNKMGDSVTFSANSTADLADSITTQVNSSEQSGEIIISPSDLNPVNEKQSSLNVCNPGNINPAPDPDLNDAEMKSPENSKELGPAVEIKQEDGGCLKFPLVNYEIYSDESDCEMIDIEDQVSNVASEDSKLDLQELLNNPLSEIVVPVLEESVSVPSLLVQIKEEPLDKPCRVKSSLAVKPLRKNKKLKSEVAKLYNIYQKVDFQIPNPADSDVESLEDSSSSDSSDSTDSEEEIVFTGPYREPIEVILSSDTEEESKHESSSSDSSEAEDNAVEIPVVDTKKINRPQLRKKKDSIDTESISYKLGFNGILPNIEDLHISIGEEEAKAIGCIENIIGVQVIIRSYPGIPAINLDSVLFLERGKRALGKVFDVFGHVSEPYYMVRFNSEEHVKANDVVIGSEVFFAPQSDHTKYVLLDDLMKQKYSDRYHGAIRYQEHASDEEEIDFSDDEEERRYHQDKEKKDGCKPRKRLRSRNPFEDVHSLPNYHRSNERNSYNNGNDWKPSRGYDSNRFRSGGRRGSERSHSYNDGGLMDHKNSPRPNGNIVCGNDVQILDCGGSTLPNRNTNAWDNKTGRFKRHEPNDRPVIVNIDPWESRPSPSASPLLNKHKFGQLTVLGNDDTSVPPPSLPHTKNMSVPPPSLLVEDIKPFVNLSGNIHRSSNKMFDRNRLPPSLKTSNRNPIMCMPPPPLPNDNPPPPISTHPLLSPGHFQSTKPLTRITQLVPLPVPISQRAESSTLLSMPPPSISPINMPPPPLSSINTDASFHLPTNVPQLIMSVMQNGVPRVSNVMPSLPNIQSSSLVIGQPPRPNSVESTHGSPLNLLNRQNPWDRPPIVHNNQGGLPNPWAIPPNFKPS